MCFQLCINGFGVQVVNRQQKLLQVSAVFTQPASLPLDTIRCLRLMLWKTGSWQSSPRSPNSF